MRLFFALSNLLDDSTGDIRAKTFDPCCFASKFKHIVPGLRFWYGSGSLWSYYTIPSVQDRHMLDTPRLHRQKWILRQHRFHHFIKSKPVSLTLFINLQYNVFPHYWIMNEEFEDPQNKNNFIHPPAGDGLVVASPKRISDKLKSPPARGPAR